MNDFQFGDEGGQDDGRGGPAETLAQIFHIPDSAEHFDHIQNIATQFVATISAHNEIDRPDLGIPSPGLVATDHLESRGMDYGGRLGEYLLEEGDNLRQLGTSQLFEFEDGLGTADEDLRLSLGAVLVQADVFEDRHAAVPRGHPPRVRPCPRTQHLVSEPVPFETTRLFSPIDKTVIRHPMGEAGPPNPHILQEAQIPDLVFDAFHVEGRAALLFVRFDTADVVGLLAGQLSHQFGHGVLEQVAGSRWAPVDQVGRFGTVGEEDLQQGILTETNYYLFLLQYSPLL